MFNQKVSKQVEEAQVTVSECPICHSFCQHQYYMEDAKSKKKSRWHSCACGVIFQKDNPVGVYDEKYLTDYNNAGSKYAESAKYPVSLYAPMIEELVYGRKVLIVGTPTHHQVEEFRNRGWVAYSIDKNYSIASTSRHFVGDYETFEFPEGLEFNLIWMYSVLECFNQPIETIKKTFTLMPEDGILFLATPDTDFVYTRSSAAFVNWKPEYNNIMWNKRSLVSNLEKLGFEIITARRNYEHRFPAVDDIHILAQKKFF